MVLFFARAVAKEFVKSNVLTSKRLLCLSRLQMTAASGSSGVKMKLVCTWTPFIRIITKCSVNCLLHMQSIAMLLSGLKRTCSSRVLPNTEFWERSLATVILILISPG